MMPTARTQPTDHALNARSEKRSRAHDLGIDEEWVSQLIDHFYALIQDDDLLGPIFAQRIFNWPEHLERMKTFWRSILFNSGEFSGNPMLKHMTIPGLDAEHFAHWLRLFYAALDDLDAQPEGNAIVAARARTIADSLLTGISVRREGLAGSRAGEGLPHA